MAAAEIFVTLKPGLFDAQGTTVLKALHQLGHQQVRGVRIGKYITVDMEETASDASIQEQLNLMCRQLLANPVIEDYEVTLTPQLAVAPVQGAVPVITARAAASTSAAVTSLPGSGTVEPVTTPGGIAVTDPFILDYTSYQALTTEARLALQQAAWLQQGPWIQQQLREHAAAWILCVGKRVLESGGSLDSLPDETRQANLGVAHDLVPFVFVAESAPAPRASAL